MSNVALKLLTTDAPTETKQDLAASAQLVSSTGTPTTSAFLVLILVAGCMPQCLATRTAMLSVVFVCCLLPSVQLAG